MTADSPGVLGKRTSAVSSLMTDDVRGPFCFCPGVETGFGLFFKDDGCTAAILLLMAGRCRDVCLAAEGGYVFVCTD